MEEVSIANEIEYMASITHEYLSEISLRNRKHFLPLYEILSSEETLYYYCLHHFNSFCHLQQATTQTKDMRIRSKQNHKKMSLEKS